MGKNLGLKAEKARLGRANNRPKVVKLNSSLAIALTAPFRKKAWRFGTVATSSPKLAGRLTRLASARQSWVRPAPKVYDSGARVYEGARPDPDKTGSELRVY
jgi:hypothetical protein